MAVTVTELWPLPSTGPVAPTMGPAQRCSCAGALCAAGTWPGLSPSQLCERRGLRVRLDALDCSVFPGSDFITPLAGLVRA